ncbi:MAG: hypothetical protein ABMA13_23405 [Chthoniobacteraceae bacterium]
MEPTPPLASGIPVHCAHHAIVSIHELKPHPSNPNKHPERQLVLYAEAIRQNGWREAITISRRSGFIVSGNGAAEAARRLGAMEAPVEYQDYASEHEELADLLAHNRLPEMAVKDGAKLADILQQLGGAASVLATGYSPAVIAELLEQIAPPPQYPITPRLNETHRLLCIVVESETDWAFLRNLAGIRVERSYKNASVGEGHVVTFERFLDQLRANLDSLRARPAE